MRKMFLFAIIVISLLLMLSGCGSESPPAEPATAPPEAGDVAVVEEAAEAEEAVVSTPVPTDTSVPTDTPVPPTATSPLPTPTMETADTPMPPTATPPPTPEPIALEITSAAFGAEEDIPEKFSCDGENISPQLEWNDPPQGTQSFVLIFDDPDAVEVVGHTWVHWTLFNLPAETRVLSEAIPADAELAGGGLHGQNSWDRIGYGGPCPPEGTHRYYFKLYALDTLLELANEATAEDLVEAMDGHILAQAELMGLYTR